MCEAQLHWAQAHIIAKHIICTKCNIVHLCRVGGNDVSLRLNDVACKHANDVVPAAQMKKSRKRSFQDFFGCGIGILRVLYSFIRRSATLPLCARSPVALQTCPRHVCSAQPPCPSNPFRTKQKNHRVVVFCFGCGIGIRTPTNRVRVCRAAVTQFRSIFCALSRAQVILSSIILNVKCFLIFFRLFLRLPSYY